MPHKNQLFFLLNSDMKVVDKISGTENSFIVERSTFFDKAGCQVNLPLCLEKDFFNKIMIKNIEI